MEQDEKQAFWRFTIRYNFLLLGSLYLLLLGFTISHVPDRMAGVIDVWKLLLNLMAMAVAFGAWILCIRKSWILTDFDISLRVATMAYLFGAPTILLFVTGDIIEAAMQVLGM